MSLSNTLSKKEEKRLYDIEYRRKNKEKLKLKKQAYCETDEGRAMQKRARLKRTNEHAEYIKTEKYKAWKRRYDEIYLAKKKYGEYWECMIIFKKIDNILREMFPTSYERRKARGYYRNLF